MKLYTEEQIKEMLDFFQVRDEDIVQFIEKMTPIELPSDEEIHDKSIKYYTNITASFYFELGAKWMRDLIQGGNK